MSAYPEFDRLVYVVRLIDAADNKPDATQRLTEALTRAGITDDLARRMRVHFRNYCQLWAEHAATIKAANKPEFDDLVRHDMRLFDHDAKEAAKRLGKRHDGSRLACRKGDAENDPVLWVYALQAGLLDKAAAPSA